MEERKSEVNCKRKGKGSVPGKYTFNNIRYIKKLKKIKIKVFFERKDWYSLQTGNKHFAPFDA